MIYFDSASTTPLHPEVLKTYKYLLETYFTNSESLYDTGVKVNKLMEQSREQIASMLGIHEKEVIFTSGATEGLNLIARGFFENLLEPNDEILLTKSEHASNILPWFRLAKKIGVTIKYIDLDGNKKRHRLVKKD